MYIDLVVVYQLLIVGLAWFIAQIIKVILGHSSFSKNSLFSTSGGMPSAHTTSISAFFFSELFFNGLTSTAGLAVIVLVVIVVDAIGVRYATGVNAKILSSSLKDKKLKNKIILKEGHTKLEVVAGFFLGGLVSLACYFIVSGFLL